MLSNTLKALNSNEILFSVRPSLRKYKHSYFLDASFLQNVSRRRQKRKSDRRTTSQQANQYGSRSVRRLLRGRRSRYDVEKWIRKMKNLTSTTGKSGTAEEAQAFGVQVFCSQLPRHSAVSPLRSGIAGHLRAYVRKIRPLQLGFARMKPFLTRIRREGAAERGRIAVPA
jgi:hypothetical protein